MFRTVCLCALALFLLVEPCAAQDWRSAFIGDIPHDLTEEGLEQGIFNEDLRDDPAPHVEMAGEGVFGAHLDGIVYEKYSFRLKFPMVATKEFQAVVRREAFAALDADMNESLSMLYAGWEPKPSYHFYKFHCKLYVFLPGDNITSLLKLSYEVQGGHWHGRFKCANYFQMTGEPVSREYIFPDTEASMQRYFAYVRPLYDGILARMQQVDDRAEDRHPGGLPPELMPENLVYSEMGGTGVMQALVFGYKAPYSTVLDMPKDVLLDMGANPEIWEKRPWPPPDYSSPPAR